ncbi:Histone deacetylase-like amidohydrolase [Planctomycetes bacterium Pla163]|uniref:Histone deacetylase-like amidohydrolase n=1 Tax=Rohdeia mirabilis TaxID=2528008 RepID=A0A518D187_9BACT|nr:Histone deacetylase-like amidohydrolase [Planctomycetes bacterium Pla163]
MQTPSSHGLVVLDGGDGPHRASDGRRPIPHAERPERTRAVEDVLRGAAFADRLVFEAAPLAERDLVTRVHSPRHVEAIERRCASGGGWFDSDTYCAPESFDIALRAVGAAVRAARAVTDGEYASAFAACRPPGHHAERDRPMGFCLFDQVAVCVEDLVATGRASRVFVLDFDVHHGNGTQHLFEERADVFYASLHQSHCFPGTGAAHERGVGAGAGATLNVPLPAGSGPDLWLRALDEQVLPALASFAPDVLVFSAGFDGHRADPLASCELESATFGEITRLALDAARPSTGGRAVSVLEGGYELTALGESAAAHVEALLAER